VGGRLERFWTNDDLARKLGDIARTESIDAVLHAADLCDFRVDQVRNDPGETLVSEKFATRGGRLHLVLAPATKVLPQLRGCFPHARIVGWKYGLAVTRADAFDRAWRQIHDGGTDACVLNGAAYGEGFAICHPAGSSHPARISVSFARRWNAGWRLIGRALLKAGEPFDSGCKVPPRRATYPPAATPAGTNFRKKEADGETQLLS